MSVAVGPGRWTTAFADALAAVGNGRALLALALTLVFLVAAVSVLGAASGWLASRSGAAGGLAFLISFIVWGTVSLIGGSATGILLADDAWGRERRTFGSALRAAVTLAPRVAVLVLLAGATLLLGLLLLVLLLLPCKIPMLGPLFYGVLFPAASVAAGLLLLVLFGVLLPLAAPCIWNGSDVAATVATLAVLIRHHLPSLLFQVLLLTVLGLAVGVIAGAVAFGGAGVVASLSQLVLDVGDDAPVWGMATMAGDGYAKAFSFAMMVVTLIAVLPALLVVMKGMVIIHRDAVDDLDVDAAAHEFRQSLNGLGARLRAMRQSLPARQRTVTGGADAPRVCPNAECGKVAGPDELFCTACGERLK